MIARGAVGLVAAVALCFAGVSVLLGEAGPGASGFAEGAGRGITLAGGALLAGALALLGHAGRRRWERRLVPVQAPYDGALGTALLVVAVWFGVGLLGVVLLVVGLVAAAFMGELTWLIAGFLAGGLMLTAGAALALTGGAGLGRRLAGLVRRGSE